MDLTHRIYKTEMQHSTEKTLHPGSLPFRVCYSYHPAGACFFSHKTFPWFYLTTTYPCCHNFRVQNICLLYYRVEYQLYLYIGFIYWVVMKFRIGFVVKEPFNEVKMTRQRTWTVSVAWWQRTKYWIGTDRHEAYVQQLKHQEKLEAFYVTTREQGASGMNFWGGNFFLFIQVN